MTNRREFLMHSASLAVASAASATASSAFAQSASAPSPRTAFQAATIEEQVIYGSAVQAVIWGMPAVNSDRIFQAMFRDAKGDVNQIVYWSRPFDWKCQLLTPNTDVLYAIPFIDTRKEPMVVEIPSAGAASITGSLFNFWQHALEDVGTAGMDKGKGGKYLIIPPGYQGAVPDGYFALGSSTFQAFGLLRSIPRSGSAADMAAAVAYMKTIKLYPLSQAANPPQTTYVDATEVIFDCVIPYDRRYFESLHRAIQTEPWFDRDRVMIDTLKRVGIAKGSQFSPNARTVELLNAAAADAKQWLDHRYEAFPRYYPEKRWILPYDEEFVRSSAADFNTPESYPIDSRAATFYCLWSAIRHIGPGQFYLFGPFDKNGNAMDGGRNYRLKVPANVPVRQYWSVTAYDFATHALIRDVPYGSRSSLTPELFSNADGTVDLYFGPSAPAGRESNWVPTKAGGRFETIFRLYGPDKPLLDKSWVLPDLEPIA